MDAKTARTLNTRALVATDGGPTAFANKYGAGEKSNWTQEQVSQWISETKPKGIGHRLAREIERRVGLGPGALDQPPQGTPAVDARPPLTRPDPEILVKAYKEVARRLSVKDGYFNLAAHADLFADMYRAIAENGGKVPRRVGAAKETGGSRGQQGMGGAASPH